MQPHIRPEKPGDHAAIYDVTERAFAPKPYSDGDEQDLINRLRDADALEISLVAETDGQLVGQVTFSEGFAADGSKGWYALGPVAVEPKLQSKKIGAKLIEAGLDMLRERDAAGCVLIGNPTYYSRFGFQLFPELCPAGEPAEYFQVLPMKVKKPNTVVGFHPLFHG